MNKSATADIEPQLIDLFARVRENTSVGKTVWNSADLRLLAELIEKHANNPQARTVFYANAICKSKSALVAMSIRFPGSCVHCSREISAGHTAFLDMNTRRLHCLRCDVLQELPPSTTRPIKKCNWLLRLWQKVKSRF